MKIKIDNVKQDNIVIFDIEYDQNSLVQIAFLILSVVEPNIFEVRKSFNVYVNPNHSLNHFFTQYTNITDAFLRDNGVDLAGAETLVNEVMLDIDVDKTLVVSHGIKSDMSILDQTNFKLKEIKNRYCTYTNAKKILKRKDRLTLKDVAAEGCYYIFNEHNAYADVWGTLYAFVFLKEKEEQEKRETI